MISTRPRKKPAAFSLELVLAIAAMTGLFSAGCNMSPPAPAFDHSSTETNRAEFPSATDPIESSTDWHRWRGPHLTGISTETNWTADWAPAGPPRLWRASVGTGFSSMAVRNGKLYTMGNKDKQDYVFCLDAQTGEEVWTYSYPADPDPKYYEGGPSATPTVDGATVYTLSKAGDLFCFNAETGQVIWSQNLVHELGLEVPSWGFAGSPLVQDNLLIVNAGRHGTALDKKTGKVIWKTGSGASGYASPVPFTLDEIECVAIFAADAIVGLRVKDGKQLWRFPWKTDHDVNAADPIISGNHIFISSGYGKGCALVRFSKEDAQLVWHNKVMRNHVNSCVLIDEHLYGIDGQAGDSRAELKCLEFMTGKVKWAERVAGGGSVIAAGSRLIILNGRGELIVAQASPQQFEPLARAQVIGGKNWTAPVLAQGRIYCRNAQGDLVCLDVTPPAPNPQLPPQI